MRERSSGALAMILQQLNVARGLADRVDHQCLAHVVAVVLHHDLVVADSTELRKESAVYSIQYSYE
jgi:hypothetical protein